MNYIIRIFFNLFPNKIYTLFTFIIFFSIIYLFLDDKHFSGVNFVKDAIKEEVIKKKIEKKINPGEIKEAFSLELPAAFTFQKEKKQNTVEEQKDVIKKIDKVAEDTEKEVDEEELVPEKIETSNIQKLFDRLYFSIITSTLLGYGDIYPITNISKMIVMTQSLLTISLIVV